MSEATLASLRAAGAHRLDPLRFHYLEVLERRLPTQAPAVRELLACKLQQAVQHYAERARAAAATQSPAQEPGPDSPLRQLNRELRARVQTAPGDTSVADAGGEPELQSARRFHEVWSKIAVERQFKQILTQVPENAGPLNSHKLMLRALTLMHTLSPDYLRHFLSRMDALLWLEQAHARLPLAEPRPGRRERRKA